MQLTPAVIRPAGQSQSQSHLWQPVDLQAKAFRSYLQVHPVCVCVCQRVRVDVWWIGNADSFVCHHKKGKKSTELGGTLARSSLAQRRTGTTRATCRNMEPPSSLMNTSPIPPRTSAILSVTSVQYVSFAVHGY